LCQRLLAKPKQSAPKVRRVQLRDPWAWLLRFFVVVIARFSNGVLYMILRKDIERLAELKSDHGIVSAYIRLDPRLRFLRRQPVSQFKGALTAAQRQYHGSRWQGALERETPYVLDFLSRWEPSGRGLVIFSCHPADIWEIFPLDVLVPNLVDVDSTTRTGILLQVLEDLPRFVVVVLQRDKARIYVSEQGISEEQIEFTSEVPGRHDQGGRSQMRYQRHIEFHVEEHLKRVIDELKSVASARPFKLAFGGTEETVNELLKMIPTQMAKSVIGRFPVDYKQDSEQEIFQRAEALWDSQEQLEENKLVDQIFDAAKSATQGALGAEATLNALTEEKVRTLLVVGGLEIAGSACTQCDYFSAKKFDKCPLCGAAAEQRDVADRAVEKAILTGADTQVVSSGKARARLLAEGGLGALLRY
jgi:peptide chain release factor subunit 1